MLGGGGWGGHVVVVCGLIEGVELSKVRCGLFEKYLWYETFPLAIIYYQEIFLYKYTGSQLHKNSTRGKTQLLNLKSGYVKKRIIIVPWTKLLKMFGHNFPVPCVYHLKVVRMNAWHCVVSLEA